MMQVFAVNCSGQVLMLFTTLQQAVESIKLSYSKIGFVETNPKHYRTNDGFELSITVHTVYSTINHL